jgi:uncharacterized protein with PIN domain
MNPLAPDDRVWEDYERAFRGLLWRIKTEPLQPGVEKRLSTARHLISAGQSDDAALATVYQQTRDDVYQQLLRNGSSVARSSRYPSRREVLLDAGLPREPVLSGPDFHCDASLGGLARWLRAAGYDAAFWPGIDDADLLRKLPGSSAILLTTDRPLMDRGLIATGAIPALLTSIRFNKREQFLDVMTRLDLPVKPPRCMACGGRLLRVDKESVRERIPPRTYVWQDDYYQCDRCGQLFWEGTHWQRIREELGSAGGSRRNPPERNPQST